MVSNDLTIYCDYAHEWWIPGAIRFRSLQNITPFRLDLIEELLGGVAGRVVYDIGCGGGLLSVPLLDLGAEVVGVDISSASIAAARGAARGRGEFFVGDARSVPLPDGTADIVLLADLVDHIPDYNVALMEASRLLKPGGKVFVGTINRTLRSWIGAIILGEGLRLIPPGTHRWSMFVKPAELAGAGVAAKLRLITTQGESIDLWQTIRRWAIHLNRSPDCSMAYSMVFEKSGDSGEL